MSQNKTQTRVICELTHYPCIVTGKMDLRINGYIRILEKGHSFGTIWLGLTKKYAHLHFMLSKFHLENLKTVKGGWDPTD